MTREKSSSPPLAALLFDVDGTLADTEEIHRRAFNEAFAAAGLQWHWDQPLYRELLEVTGGRERIRFFLERYPRPDAPGDDLDASIAQLHLDKTAIYNHILAEGVVPLRPGVERLIEEARAAGLQLAIATTTTPVNVTSLLENSFSGDVSGYFAVIAAGNVVPDKKPAADIYHYALQQLGLQASQCLAIEDSANGLCAARGAGIDTVITVNRYTSGQDFSGAALVLDQLGEPDSACRVLQGGLDPGGMVDVSFLRRLHAHCEQQRMAVEIQA